MKVIIQRTRRKKTEHGYYFNEDPIVVCLDEKFKDRVKEETPCGCGKCSPSHQKKHLITIPFGKYHSKCEKELNPCIPSDALEYKEGKWSEIPNCGEC